MYLPLVRLGAAVGSTAIKRIPLPFLSSLPTKGSTNPENDEPPPMPPLMMSGPSAASLGGVGGTGHGGGPVGFHHDPAVRLLLVGGLHHLDFTGDPEEAAGQGQGAAPLSGPGLGGEGLHPLLL